MNPSDWPPADLHQDPIFFTRLGKHGRSESQHRKNDFRGRRPGSQIDAGCRNQSDIPTSLNDIRFLENRLGDATCAINEEECSTKSIFFDLTFGFRELGPGFRDLLGSPGCTRGGSFNLDTGLCDR